MKKMCFIFHDWENWKQYSIKVKEEYMMIGIDTDWSNQIREKRICKQCGKMQDRIVR